MYREKNIICLDFGLERVGLALGQEGLVTPYGVLKNDAGFFTNLSKVIEEFKIEKIVIGIPVKTSQMAQKVREFGHKVESFFPTGEVEFWDEQYSSVEAQRILESQGKGIKESKKLIDALSASIILQSYLDSQKKKNA